jgi:SAM-dependent methyltransferase
VTGIEWDAALAGRARSRCDRVVEGDLARSLPVLEREGERFDAIVFADVLEHLDDPVAALTAARRVAAAGARLLVSVPNVGHLSIARDLVAGRFDPIPAGLTDARHLRWFTRLSLEEALQEAGWRDVTIEGEAGAPAPDASGFLALASAWPDCDRESLATYQWIAAGTA